MSFADKRRTRTVNFRVSPEEYEQLRQACAAEGARSLSDFARMAVFRNGAPLGTALDDRMERLERRLEDLTDALAGRRSRAATSGELG